MTTKRADIAKQLVPGLNKVFGTNYGLIDQEHKPLFDMENSKRSFEEEVLQTRLGTAPTKTEGAAVQYDDIAEMWTARYVMETIALAFAVTEEAFEDEQYATISTNKAKFLGFSMANTKQVKASNIFNLGFTNNGGDGVPLFSASHPTREDGNQSNTVATDLSETALENAVIGVKQTKDDRGLLIGNNVRSIHIPSQLEFVAKKILGSEYSTTNATQGTDGITNLNDVNIVTQGYFPGGMSINHRFTDTDAWFLRNTCTNGTKMFDRVKLKTANEGDFDTGNFRFKARERYAFGHSDWRQWYGSTGSA